MGLSTFVPAHGPRHRGVYPALALVASVVAAGVSTPAHASLTIVPTFDPSIASVPGAEGAIDAAITTLETDISSPKNISVSIYFANMSSGLGESTTSLASMAYYTYYNAFEKIATQPNQLTALASLGPAPGVNTPNPVNGTPNIFVSSAEARNLGFNVPGSLTVNNLDFDSEIHLNTSITSPPNGLGGNYGLESVAQHEIDEALGIGGIGSFLGKTAGFATGVGDLDLYRYSAAGVRSYVTTDTTNPLSYFSIDGGTTVLSYFNQTSGADYGDWLSDPIPSGFSPQVQDAFGEPGTDPALGPNELIALNAIGYDLTSPPPSPVPEPGSLVIILSALAGMFGLRRRMRGSYR